MTGLPLTEKGRSVPLGAGDGEGDLTEGGEVPPPVVEAFLLHPDLMAFPSPVLHEATAGLEEVERMGGCLQPFLVRTLDPEREIDKSVERVMNDMLNETGIRIRPVDTELAGQVAVLSADRRRSMATIRRRAELECEIADLVERIATREKFSVSDNRPVEEIAREMAC